MVENIKTLKEEKRKRELLKSSIDLLTEQFGMLPHKAKVKLKNSDILVLEMIVNGILRFESLGEI